ncbi:MAG: class I SAM-dependent methyltransferase [Janthinobacterium lividum]
MTSISYYDRNADAFFASTVNADMAEARGQFLTHIDTGAHVLDAGCGSGRDTKAFLEHGLLVTAFDASKELVERATEYAGIAVRTMTFDQMEWTEEFDGIWACASLLHVPRSDLPSIMSKLGSALRAGSVLYGSFKYGNTETEKDGRTFTNQTEDTLNDLIEELPDLALIRTWQSLDVRQTRNDQWLNFLCKKKGSKEIFVRKHSS